MKAQTTILLVLFLTSAVTFLVCDSVEDNGVNNVNYFPLKVNNSWSYYSLNGNMATSNKIVKKIIINSKEYYIYTNLSDYNQGDTIRIDNNRIYRRNNNSDVLWLDLNAADNTHYNYLEYNVTVTRNLSVKCKAGNFNNCIDIFFDAPGIADEEHGYTFAKGVGIVRIHSAWFNFYLDKYSLPE